MQKDACPSVHDNGLMGHGEHLAYLIEGLR